MLPISFLKRLSGVLFCQSLLLSTLFLSSCYRIELKPKDPELIALGNFADEVTKHLLDTNPSTYEKYQASLAEELAPHVLAQLRARGGCAKTLTDAKSRVTAMTKANEHCAVRIDSTDFPSKATPQGLVPIEVSGSYVTSSGDLSRAFKFDVLYLVGTNVKTKRPIIASIQVKKLGS